MPYPDYEEEKQQFFFYCMYGFLCLFMICTLGSAAYEGIHSYKRYTYGAVAQGTVVAAYVHDYEGETKVYEVSFKTPDGEQYTVENHFHMMDDLYRTGDLASVVYLPEDPADGRIDNFKERYWVTLGCVLMASMALLMALVFYYKFHRPWLRAQLLPKT